jgi:hypothetical protein
MHFIPCFTVLKAVELFLDSGVPKRPCFMGSGFAIRARAEAEMG